MTDQCDLLETYCWCQSLDHSRYWLDCRLILLDLFYFLLLYKFEKF